MIKLRFDAGIIVAALALAISACSGDAAKAKADSAAAHDSVAARDSAVADSTRAAIARTNDSLAAAAGNAATSGAASTTGTTGETRKVNDPATSNPPPGKVIGRDSTFGPVGMIDSKGKITRIKRKY